MFQLIETANDSRKAQIYRFGLIGIGLIISFWALVNVPVAEMTHLALFIGIVCVTLVAGFFPIRIPETQTCITAGNALFFLSLIYLGISEAIIVALVDACVSRVRVERKPFKDLATGAGAAAIVAIAAGQIFYFAIGNHAGINSQPMMNDLLDFKDAALGLGISAVAQFLLGNLIVAFYLTHKNEKSLWQVWTSDVLSSSWSILAGVVAAAVVYYASAHYGVISGLMSVPFVLLPYAAYKMHFRQMGKKNSEIAEMSRIQLAAVQTLAAAVDAREQTSPGHTRRVQIYAVGLGKALEFSDTEIKSLEAAALLHDIGKLAVPDYILNKPDKLTGPEMDKVKIHSAVGAEILTSVGFPYPVVPAVLHHHERWDGEGYPEGLIGEEIPATARALAIADAYDSLREKRSYRERLSREEARRALLAGAGRQFDPRFVDVFLRHLKHIESEIESLGIEPENTQSNSAVPGYFAEIQRANGEVFALYDLARVTSSSLNANETVELFLEKVCELVPMETCVVYLYDENRQMAVAAHSVGKNAAFLRERKVRLGEGVTGFVLKNQKAVSSVSPALDFTAEYVEIAQDYTTMIALPLKAGGRLIGAVSCYSETLLGYDEEHLRLLETVSRIASEALWRTIQHAETESRALTDPMTGLPNARCLQIQFDKEVSRSRRTKKPFQVIMLDLDEFKKVNDTFGHKVGDWLLREVSREMRAQLRDYDFLARYAGDEFVALVPELVGEPLEELCRRVEQAVTNFSLPVGKQGAARVGVSIGTAAFPYEGETLDQVLIAADQNMYSVKASHKRSRRDSLAGSDILELDKSEIFSTALN